ncbi:MULTISPECIES: TetR/AcrR family transcriptional regulator [unclassified Streptomyces]|uniref:TetR/AcrR family transcriptional regulator n=1 Tax=unclassified Streptomyces TaxID=2593676 RepID=UPI002ED1B2AC|nr:TetR/AcrR family transcriptional regulator [Streptomyces sp. NBC_00891]WSY06948.1 TetR/AcrR family transcriptional regulator [Streptomyces sp. NBC_00890]WSZ08574.1 TetR/AcrR family transcriptional regulator [Streptomyces sp. NBC_00869]WSZ23927.1 TetR/AcrR family transcriptional regulator [Streptomyces sp. NBC_00870]
MSGIPPAGGGGSGARRGSSGRVSSAEDTRTKLLTGALATLTEQGIAKTSARSIAATAGVNQALVFYHFGTVDDLLAAACRHGAEQRLATYRERLDGVRSLGELLAVARELNASERAGGHVAVLGQLLAGGQTQPRLAAATAAGLTLWTDEIERVLARVLADTPLSEFVDVGGLAKAASAAFVGLELYEGVDPDGAERALAALDQLAELAAALEGLGPVAQRAVRSRLRRSGNRGRA